MFLPSCILLVTKVKVGEYKKAFLILPLNLEICGMFPLFSPFSFDRQRVVDRRERYRQVRAFLNSGEQIRTFFMLFVTQSVFSFLIFFVGFCRPSSELHRRHWKFRKWKQIWLQKPISDGCTGRSIFFCIELEAVWSWLIHYKYSLKQ